MMFSNVDVKCRIKTPAIHFQDQKYRNGNVQSLAVCRRRFGHLMLSVGVNVCMCGWEGEKVGQWGQGKKVKNGTVDS
jgi:hypothetical protein